MMVTGAKYCIFITYHPHYRGALSLGHARIERDEKAIVSSEQSWRLLS
jgi:hypothetical protein